MVTFKGKNTMRKILLVTILTLILMVKLQLTYLQVPVMLIYMLFNQRGEVIFTAMAMFMNLTPGV